MNVLTLFYCFSWGCVFLITTPAVGVLKGRLDIEQLPLWLAGNKGRNLALLAGTLSWLSAPSLLAWAVLHLTWYWALGGWLCGLLLSALLRRSLPPENLILIGPPALLLLNAFLWILAS